MENRRQRAVPVWAAARCKLRSDDSINLFGSGQTVRKLYYVLKTSQAMEGIDTGKDRNRMKRFKIGFTFVGSVYREKYIRPICNELLKLGLCKEDIFFDEWHTALIVGADADVKLGKIYYEQCELIVPLLSPDYNVTHWTGNVEWQAVRAVLRDRQRRDTVYLLGVDNVKVDAVDGLFNALTILDYVDNTDYGSNGIGIISAHIKEKYEQVINRPLEVKIEEIRHLTERGNIEEDLRDSDGEEFLLHIDAYEDRGLELSQWIEYGYWLTDAYERAKRFDMSTRIAKKLLSLIGGNNAAFELGEYRKIRFDIGLVYSLSIAKVREPDHSENLQTAKDAMEGKIKEELEKSSLDENRRNELWGMYHSNYGALKMNEGLVSRSLGDEEKAEADFQEALEHHQQALEIRKELTKAYAKDMPFETYGRAASTVTQSMNNIASTVFQLGKYEEAIEQHRQVISRWEGNGQIGKAYTSRKYILGCFIEKWKKDGRIPADEEKEFLRLLDDCKSYYTDEHSTSYQEIWEKERQYKEIKNRRNI